MHILVVSNFYPPHYIGGYELACHEMVDALESRGHEVRVLTSTYGVAGRSREGHVWRWLHTDLGWDVEEFPRYLGHVLRREIADQHAFRRLCSAFRPQVVYAWNLQHLSLSLCARAQERGLPVCYFVFDHWLPDYERDPWLALVGHRPRRLARRLAWAATRPILKAAGILPRPRGLDLSRVQFASEYLKQAALRAGKPVAHAEVIYWGLDLARYPYIGTPPGGSRLLYVGQVAPHKGVHTAIQALRLLREERAVPEATLTIVGGTIFPNYAAELRQLAARLGLERHVHFRGARPREELPGLYAEHDLLLFPSEWDEPFGITLLEGMAAGIPVVATATGGAAEILQDGVNALVFSRGDAAGCAARARMLLQDRGLRERIRTAARRTVEARFRLEYTVEQIERALMMTVCAARTPDGRHGAQ